MCSAKTLDIKGLNAKLLGPNITCRALQLKKADQARSMYIGNQNKQIWAPITYIGPGPEVLRSAKTVDIKELNAKLLCPRIIDRA